MDRDGRVKGRRGEYNAVIAVIKVSSNCNSFTSLKRGYAGEDWVEKAAEKAL